MERLTFDGNFCDIAVCMETPCKYPDGGCTQKQVWEHLKAYEVAEEQGRLVVLPAEDGGEAAVLRDDVNGKKKYCRIVIRRRRAPIVRAIEYFREAIIDGDEFISEYSAEEQKLLREQQSCFVTAVVALEAVARAEAEAALRDEE